MHGALLEVWSVQDDLTPLQHQHSKVGLMEGMETELPK